MNAILVTSAVSLVLAVSGRYSDLALVSAISRLLVYVATCASTLRLRAARFSGRVNPATFVVPFGPVIPGAAIVIALAMLAGARREQLIAGIISLVVGGVLYLIAVRSMRGGAAIRTNFEQELGDREIHCKSPSNS